MVSILAFDSASIKSLLNNHNAEYFNPQFPIFYKNKEEKMDPSQKRSLGMSSIECASSKNEAENCSFNNSIDVAIKNN